ncbi:hypothetical protein [Paractinoplanes deccanensis]|nr:hypothetical protein [Actinoplanes deccanensis]
MTRIPSGVAWRPYLRALAGAGLDVASAGAWVAAGDLSPARRRLARGALAAIAAAGAIPEVRAWRSTVAGTERAVPGARSGLPFVDVGIELPAAELSEEEAAEGRRRAVLAGAVGVGVVITAVVVSVGAAAASREWERRWLARLTRHGHSHPHRALAVRMAGLYAVLAVPSRLLAARQDTQAGRRIAGDHTTVPE